jgi:hypothetical protein
MLDESLFYYLHEPELCAPLPEHVVDVIKTITITEIPERTALMTQLDYLSTGFQ